MPAQRVSIISLFCAIILMASPLMCQSQTSGPRAELGPLVTEPHPDFGVINSKHYVNSYFGFSYRYPEGFNGTAVQAATGGASQYALFTGNPASSDGTDMRYIAINADPLPKNTTPKTFIEGALRTFTGPGGGFNVLHSDKQITFGGKQFYRMDMVSKPTPGMPTVYQTQLFMISSNYAVTFTFMAVNVDDMETLVRSMESLNFEQPQAAGPARAQAR